jgi:hypothetical protein
LNHINEYQVLKQHRVICISTKWKGSIIYMISIIHASRMGIELIVTNIMQAKNKAMNIKRVAKSKCEIQAIEYIK